MFGEKRDRRPFPLGLSSAPRRGRAPQQVTGGQRRVLGDSVLNERSAGSSARLRDFHREHTRVRLVSSEYAAKPTTRCGAKAPSCRRPPPPDIIATMPDLLQVSPGQRVPEIGTGTGYSPALLSHLVGGKGWGLLAHLLVARRTFAGNNLVTGSFPGQCERSHSCHKEM
ncbi:hypothetical protein [Nonomuraea sp. NPDC049784]|uniref:hypothetical protein n=1 Tax=Nonomuraea sp. NPDC049784 TaxID=3154361 RepID=UPI0033E25473